MYTIYTMFTMYTIYTIYLTARNHMDRHAWVGW